MQSLARRTALALAHHPAPAVPFHAAVAAARDTGMAVTEPVLLRSLRRERDLFRVVEPCRGAPGVLPDEPWLVPLELPGAARGGPACLRRVRASLVWLGRVVDGRSARETARWLALLREEERVRGASA